MTLLRAIEVYIERSGTSPTRLGQEALNDPGLVRGLRRGRELRPKTLARLRAYLRAGGVAA